MNDQSIDPAALSVTAALEAIRGGTLNAESLVASCLARINAHEKEVQAWQHLDDEGALAVAMQRDTEPARGLLNGIPVGLKDIIETADMPTTYGSVIYQDHQPERHASCVEALRRNGAVILGKTVTTTFAHRSPGKTRNPHNPKHTPGGSSSGSAAAVACGMVPLALGSQTGGSVIRPAAYCGVVGYKPAFGAIDFTGVKQLSRTLDTLGFYVRSLDDVPLVAAVLQGGSEALAVADETAAPKVALCRTAKWDEAEAPAQQLVEATLERLGAAGAATRVLDLPDPFPDLFPAQDLIQAAGSAVELAVERAEHWDDIPKSTQESIERGAAASPAEIDAAEALAAECREALPGLVGEDEVILTLSAPGEAPKGLKSTGDPVFNRMWTFLHLPCLHIPVDKGPQGLPLGVQLVARQGSEAQLFAAARWTARALGLNLFG